MPDLDHLLWAAPDLDSGTATVDALTGVMPARGGSHPGFGTRNSLLSLGDTYLEIIAPDPSQSLEHTRGAAIAALARPGLLTFAVRTRDLGAYAEAARGAGLQVDGPVDMSRRRPDGVQLAWSCLYAQSPAYGDLIPFAIDWQGSPHPAGTTPAGCTLVEFAVLHPDPEPLRLIYEMLGIPVAVKAAPASGFSATLRSPRGEVILLGP